MWSAVDPYFVLPPTRAFTHDHSGKADHSVAGSRSIMDSIFILFFMPSLLC